MTRGTPFWPHGQTENHHSLESIDAYRETALFTTYSVTMTNARLSVGCPTPVESLCPRLALVSLLSQLACTEMFPRFGSINTMNEWLMCCMGRPIIQGILIHWSWRWFILLYYWWYIHYSTWVVPTQGRLEGFAKLYCNILALHWLVTTLL